MANTVYANKVIENKMADMLTTKLDMAQFFTTDYALTEAAGMVKEIHTYTASGNVERLNQGVGNTSVIEGSFTSAPYTVKVLQGKGVYYDEEAMKDPFIVDVIMRGMADKMVNQITSEAVTEFGEATLTQACDFSTTSNSYVFNAIVDAIGRLNVEQEEGFFILANPSAQAYLRKGLGQDLKYVEAFAKTGYIGSVVGLPLFITKAVPNSTMFIANREAVTNFIKRGVEVEQERDADTRANRLFIRQCNVVALTDATKVVKLAPSA